MAQRTTTGGEGQVYRCGWRKKGTTYRVWVKGRPKLAAEGETFNLADRRLWSIIIDATGDGESIREYDPPAPESRPEVERAARSKAKARTRAPTHTANKPPARKRDVAGQPATIEDSFAALVEDHFAFLRELGLAGPKLSSGHNALTGMSWTARFESRQRTLEITLSKAHALFPSSADFEIEAKPMRDRWEALMSVMYLRVNNVPLMQKLDEIGRGRTLEQIMELTFPIYADLFRGELKPVLTGAMWHDDHELFEEKPRRRR